jgi:SAM-dependent methyltransferase
MFERLARRLRQYAEKDGRGYPDWAMRYAPLARAMRKCEHENLRVLEIGANENGFSRFFPVRVTAVDLSHKHLVAARTAQGARPVRADAALLPFADASFDLCVCMDTFEHIAEQQRPEAASEILRVIKPDGIAIVGFPSGDKARAAEECIQKEYHAITGRTIPWFDEHKTQGLPDTDTLTAQFTQAADNTHTVRALQNTPLPLWIWMWRVLMCNWPGRGNSLFQALLRIMTPLLVHMHPRQGYRTLLWIEPKQQNSDI